MSPSQQRALKIVAGVLLAGVALIAVILVVRWVRHAPVPPPEVLQGQVDGTSVDVASKVGARVLAIAVKEGQRVKRGDVLVTLDIPEARARMAQAEAARDAAQSLEDKARRGARDEEIRQAEASWQRSQVAVALAEKTFGRVDRLSKDGVVPAQRRDEAEAALASARDVERAARAAYDLALSGARDEDKRAAAAQVARARGAVAEVEAALAESTLLAPVDGEVTAVNVSAGELVGPGAPLVSVLDSADLWATFHVREDRLAGLRVDDRFTARVPALDRADVGFGVFYIAAEASYATWRSTNAQGGFDLKTFEVRARPVSPVPSLRPGMSVIAPARLGGGR
jgi:HlyD family secretion protein